MSISYLETGRTDQKRRTRDALIAAAREQLAAGRSPTVEVAAATAAISRATAYRYFPNRRALLVAAYPEVGTDSLLGSDPTDDPKRRLDLVVEGILRLTLESEQQLRAMLRLSLDESTGDDDLVLRKGRRIVWVENALEPLRDRLPPAQRRRLVHAIAAAVGIDALVWMTDVAGLGREEAAATMRWSAQALLRAALDEPPNSGRQH